MVRTCSSHHTVNVFQVVDGVAAADWLGSGRDCEIVVQVVLEDQVGALVQAQFFPVSSRWRAIFNVKPKLFATALIEEVLLKYCIVKGNPTCLVDRVEVLKEPLAET